MNELESMKDVLEKLINKAMKFGAEYVDLRYENRAITEIVSKDNTIESIKVGSCEGLGVRILFNGSWGFSSTEVLSDRSLDSCTKTAIKLAKSSSSYKKRKVSLQKIPNFNGSVHPKIKVFPHEIDINEKVRILEDVDAHVHSTLEKVHTYFSHYDFSLQKIFMNSEGSVIDTFDVKTCLEGSVVKNIEGRIVPVFENIGGTVGMELYEKTTPIEIGKRLSQRVRHLSKAKSPLPGEWIAILDPSLTGMLIHEAFGHMAEVDVAESGSVLFGKLRQKVAAECVTIIDDGSVEGAFGWMPYDDEGVKCEKATLVKDGILSNYMHNRETASLFNTIPKGNARASSYEYDPIIRMRNTYVEPGNYDFEEIIRETKHGLYLTAQHGGQADHSGAFTVNFQIGWTIENGELRDSIHGSTITGDALSVLKSIDVVCEDLRLEAPHMCEKYQAIFVDCGGPHIRCKVKVVG